MNTLREMIERLKARPAVIGLVEFGSRHYESDSLSGDYDVFVIVDFKPNEIKVLHFFINGLPIDLNVRTIDEITSEGLQGFDTVLLDGRVIYDPKGIVGPRLAKLRQQLAQSEVSERTVLRLRQSHRSYFEKIRVRESTDSTYCRILLSYNLSELLKAYHLIYPISGKVSPPGITGVIAQIKSDSPILYEKIQAYFSSTNLHDQIMISKEITEEILRPLGGLWQKNELIALGNTATTDATPKGHKLYRLLFEEDFNQ